MSWSLFILVISACLIQAMSGCLNCRLTTCEQCQTLAFAVLWMGNDPDLTRMVEMACRTDRSFDNFCSQIEGKEAEFANTVLDYKKNGTEMEVCALANFSVCDLSEIGKNFSQPKPLDTCEQCQSGVDMIMGWASMVSIINNTLQNEVPYDRLEYYGNATDTLKKTCQDAAFGQIFSGLCTSIEGKEFEFLKAVMDCSGMKFKDDKVQPKCTVSGSNVHHGRMSKIVESRSPKQHPERKVCETFVESCKVDQLPI
ncbi:hypothetical protein Ddc_17018 [Ditylenchus destructor]|nr:hypothetical protein Ddc_17018 [Ditylenchus destructor]